MSVASVLDVPHQVPALAPEVKRGGIANNLKITARLLIGFGMLVLLVAALAIFSVYSGSGTRELFVGAVRSQNNDVKDQRFEKRVTEARMHIFAALATGDDAEWQAAADSFKGAHEMANELIATTQDTQRHERAQQLDQKLTVFEGKIAKLRDLKGSNAALGTPEGKASLADATAFANSMSDEVRSLGDSYSKAAEDRVAGATAQIDSAVSVAIGLGIVSLLLGAVISFFTARSIVVPIKGMIGAMRRLARHDLTVSVPGLGRGDEIGEMAQAVGVFKDTMIEGDRLAAEQRAEHEAKELRSAKVNALTTAFDTSIGTVVQEVALQASHMENSAQSLSAAAEEGTKQSSAVASASEEASVNVQTVSAAAEELSASIAEISRQVAQSSRVTATAVGDAEKANQMVQGLVEASKKIGEVVRLITDIANQTNLLALNATIEAARAGEAGKGFAVVAAEVKNLANQTSRATEEIGVQISGVQNATQGAVQAIETIGRTIGEINAIASTIAAAVEEQSAATKEIARNVEQAAVGTQEVSANIGGVSQAANDTGEQANQVLSSARALTQQSQSLKDIVGRFLLEVKAA